MIFISGCKKTARNTVLSTVTLEIKPTSRALPRKYGIIGMLALRPPQRCMKKGCAWRNIWQKGRQSNAAEQQVCGSSGGSDLGAGQALYLLLHFFRRFETQNVNAYIQNLQCQGN